MACFTKRGNSIRAIVTCNGVVKTRTFATESEAKVWAESVENRLKKKPFKKARLTTCNVDKSLLCCLLSREAVLASASQFSFIVGVYFLIKDGEVIYVGQSINVQERLSKHVMQGKVFDQYTIVECDVDELDLIESYYIHLFRPRQNGYRNGEIASPFSYQRLLATLGIKELSNGSIQPEGASFLSKRTREALCHNGIAL